MPPSDPLIPKSSDGFTAGRYVIADTDARGARDPIGLTSQVKLMREGMERALGGRPPGLILVVVDDDERDAAVTRLKAALETTAPSTSHVPEEADRG